MPATFKLTISYMVSQMNTSATRMNMIKQQLRTGDVLNDKILELYNEIARDEFVPSQFQAFAY